MYAQNGGQSLLPIGLQTQKLEFDLGVMDDYNCGVVQVLIVPDI